jgi:hypothetical protein
MILLRGMSNLIIISFCIFIKLHKTKLISLTSQNTYIYIRQCFWVVFYKLDFVSLRDHSLTFFIFFSWTFFLYFPLTFLSFSLTFSFLSFSILLLPSQQHIKIRKNWFVLFLMTNNHFTLNESFCFYLTVLFF